MSKFKIDDLVWAKMKGFPPWPARIIEPVCEIKSTKCKEPRYCVRFFGAKSQIAVVAASDILTFEEGRNKCSQKKISGAYKDAVNEMYLIEASSKNTGENSVLTSEIEHIKKASPKKDPSDVTGIATFASNSNKKSSPKASEKLSPKNNQKIKVNRDKKTHVKRPPTPSMRKSLSFQPSKKRIKRVLKSPSEVKKENDEDAMLQSFTFLKTVKTEEITNDETLSTVNASHENLQKDISYESDIVSEVASFSESIPLPTFDSEMDDVILSSSRVGFIGLGSMGSIILSHLINSKTKRQITIWNRTISKCKKFKEAGVVIANNPAEVMTKSDIVFSCVSDRSAVQNIVYHKKGILSGLTLGKGYVEMTTLDPDFTQNLCKDITLKKGRFLEVSMLGMKKDALSGTLLLLAAGNKELFKACRDCFQDIAEHVFFLGDVGSASKMNLIINMVKATCFTSIAEAMNLAEYAGISQKDTISILEQGLLSCPAIIDHGNAILDMVNNVDAECDNMPIEHMQRNLRLALDIADQHAQPLSTTAAVNDLYTLMRRHDKEKGTRSDVIEVYKGLGGEPKDMYLNSID